MKVLIVGLGGVTRTFRHWPERVLAMALMQQGHSVRAIGTHDPSRPALAQRNEIIEGIDVVRVRAGYWPNRELAQALRHTPYPDVIHLMHPRNVLAAQTTAWALRHNIPTVYTWLGPFHDEYLTSDRERPFDTLPTYTRPIFTYHKLIQQLLTYPTSSTTHRHLLAHWRDVVRNYRLHWPLRMATALAPCSAFEAEMMRQLGMPQPQTMVPLWIDKAFIHATPLQMPLYDLPRPWLLFVGQITLRKGYDLVVRALPIIARHYPEVSLLVVSGINQAQRDSMLELAQQIGVARHVHMLDYLPDEALINLYRASDALLFPTRYEGFGLPLLEAMAADCPIITSDIPVVNEIVRDGVNGLLIPYSNVYALAHATVLLLSQPELRMHLIAGERATLATRYVETKLVQDIESLYHEAIVLSGIHSARSTA